MLPYNLWIDVYGSYGSVLYFGSVLYLPQLYFSSLAKSVEVQVAAVAIYCFI